MNKNFSNNYRVRVWSYLSYSLIDLPKDALTITIKHFNLNMIASQEHDEDARTTISMDSAPEIMWQNNVKQHVLESNESA